MRPDFFVKQRDVSGGTLQVFIPANARALNWMLAHITENERGQISAQLTDKRASEVRHAAKSAGFKFSDEMISSVDQAKTA
jgi:hypothetical protein